MTFTVLKHPIEVLRDTVRDLHHCDSVFRTSTQVVQTSDGEPTSSREVFTFDLIGHPRARRCYAIPWGVEAIDRTRLQIVVVLHEAPVDSPTAALRAARLDRRMSSD